MRTPLFTNLYTDVRRLFTAVPDDACGLSRVLDAACAALVTHAVTGLDGGATLPVLVSLSVEVPDSPTAVRAALRTAAARAELQARLENALPGLGAPELEVLWQVSRGPRLRAGVVEEPGPAPAGVRVDAGAGRVTWPARDFALPADRPALVGRGPAFEGDPYVPNDVVLPDAARFVSRGVGELRVCGGRLWFRARPAQLDSAWRLSAGGEREGVDPVTGVLLLDASDLLALTGAADERVLLRPLPHRPSSPRPEAP